MLVSTCPNESAALSERQLALNSMGLKATYVDGRRLEALEPGLRLPKGGAALLVPADSQIVSWVRVWVRAAWIRVFGGLFLGLLHILVRSVARSKEVGSLRCCEACVADAVRGAGKLWGVCVCVS